MSTVHAAVLLLGFAAPALLGQVEGPFTLPAEFQNKQFAQVKVADCSFPLPVAPGAARWSPGVVLTGDVTVRQQPDALLEISGTDAGGHRWAVVVRNQQSGCSVWRSDLDANGQRDIIVVTSDATSGPGVEVTLLMLDAQRRPVPWQAFGYFDGSHESGLKNLVDLNGDGRAELLYLHVKGERLETGSSTLALYTTSNARWQRTKGQYEGIEFPARTPRGAKALEEPDLTNTTIGVKTSRIAALIPRTSENCALQLPITRKGDGARIDADAARALQETCLDRILFADGKTVGVPAIVVLDKPGGRAIAFEAAGQARLLSEIKAGGFAVQLTGRRCDTGCRPFILWARSQ